MHQRQSLVFNLKNKLNLIKGKSHCPTHSIEHLNSSGVYIDSTFRFPQINFINLYVTKELGP